MHIYKPSKKISARIVSQKVLRTITDSVVQGFVVSVFHRSFNIETCNKFIINVGIDDLPVTPRSILVSAEDFYNEISPKVRSGLSILCSGASIYMPEVELCICANAARKFNPKLELVGTTLLPDTKIKKNLVAATKWVESDKESVSPFSGYFLSKNSFIGNPKSKQSKEIKSSLRAKSEFVFLLRKTLWERIDCLLYAISQYLLSDILRATRDIVGLGPGLTPSGDDFVAGLISGGVTLSNMRQDMGQFVSEIARIVTKESIGRTTDLSISMIEDASNGEIAEPAVNFVQAVLLTEKLDQIKHFAKQLSSMGATSGEDFLNGIATGIWFFKKMAYK
jgi:hypothetical protein